MSINASTLIAVPVASALGASVILHFILGPNLPEGEAFAGWQYAVMFALFATVGVLSAWKAAGANAPAPAPLSPPAPPLAPAKTGTAAVRSAQAPAAPRSPSPSQPRARRAAPETESAGMDDDEEQPRNPAYANLPVETGTVKWFNSNKGFGFISRANGEDVFVHFRSVQGRNRYLKPGQTVEFKVVQSDKGIQAEEVAMVDREE